MKRWIISDTHFGHTNIIKYCDRPFLSTEVMDKELVKRWNDIVAKDDIVWHLGDFALAGREHAAEVLNSLKGRIRLVMGNHDRFPRKWYLEHFDRVYDRPVIIDTNIILSHAPIGNTTNQFSNFYGHVHEKVDKFDSWGNYNCSVEVNNYRPIDLDKLVREVQANLG